MPVDTGSGAKDAKKELLANGWLSGDSVSCSDHRLRIAGRKIK